MSLLPSLHLILATRIQSGPGLWEHTEAGMDETGFYTPPWYIPALIYWPMTFAFGYQDGDRFSSQEETLQQQKESTA